MKSKLDIILPVYYEQENIEQLLRDIKRYVQTPHRVIIVFQDKNDPTISVVKNIAMKSRNILQCMTNDGIGLIKALKAGFLIANSPIICIMMSDLSDNPKDIDKMVRIIESGYSLVCASRYSSGGKRIGGQRIKGLLSFIACKTLKIITGIPTNDATNAFKCFRREILQRIEIESKYGYELPLELTVKAMSLKLPISEIPTIWRERRSGKSKFKLFVLLPNYFRWYLFACRVRLFR